MSKYKTIYILVTFDKGLDIFGWYTSKKEAEKMQKEVEKMQKENNKKVWSTIEKMRVICNE